MKLSVESYILRERFGDFEGMKLIKDAGFDCVDMSYYWRSEKSELLGDGYREYAHKLRTYIDELGLECNQAHAPFALKYGENFNVSEPNYLELVRAIESASILGAKSIIVHSIAIPSKEKNVSLLDYNLQFYKSLQPYCEKFNICVAIENLFERNKKKKIIGGRLGTPSELCEIIKKLDSPYFVACVDVGHAAITGTLPQDFISGIDPKLLKAVHIQDGDYIDDRHILPYLGKFDWSAIMWALKNIGYEGELTFEIFKYLKNIPNELLPDALRLAEKTGRHLISVFDNK